jgi:protein TonB
MRICTLAVSVVVHAVVALTVFVAPLLAVGPLPTPRRVLAFERVVFVEPALPRAPAPTTPTPVQAGNAFPTDAPRDIEPERPVPAASSLGDPALPRFDGPPGDAAVEGIGSGVVSNPVTPPPPTVVTHDPVHVGGLIQAPTKVHHVAPQYPALARASRIQGVVILEAVIAEDGAVREVRVLKGLPLLDAAAMDAVRQWRFTPTRLNGQPVPIVMTVTVAFGLQ